jgi:hypothetical protein
MQVTVDKPQKCIWSSYEEINIIFFNDARNWIHYFITADSILIRVITNAFELKW